MKHKIIRYSKSIIALLMIVLCGVGASASTSWTVNPGDFRYDMSLYLDVSFGNVAMDYSKYEVAAFVGDECRGVAAQITFGGDRRCLYLRARSNRESGEKMTFRYRSASTGEEAQVDGVDFTFESNGRLGYPSDPFIVRIVRHFDVAISASAGGSVNTAGGRIAEGTILDLTATPDVGHHFTGWSDGSTENPRQISVSDNIDLTAEFGINSYTLSYTLDGAPYKSSSVDFGSAITPEPDPVKEGHTFSGWEGLPETMPARDVTVSGSFSINSYNAV
ncbi:MAG: InlB B-repeat-containing protein, partial [Paramuribaculum sp.]|nr:InlB B-repeat-containing protein [Paramuribaculum sp.]